MAAVLRARCVLLPRSFLQASGSRAGFLRHASSSTDPQMPPCDFKPQPYSGMSYERMMDIRSKHINPGVFAYYKQPILVNQGYMQWLFDHDGKRYLDLFAGIVTVSVGHCHPKVNDRLKEQVDKLWHTTNIYLHNGLHEYAEKLTAKLPEHLQMVYFTNSGSEANDLAMMMARIYTGSFDIVSLRNSYHGGSPYASGLTSNSNWKYPYANGFGVHGTMNADVYRGPWGGSHCRDSLSQTQRDCDCAQGSCQAGEMYAAQLKDVLLHNCTKKVAAFFAEPIQGVGGTVQYPTNFLSKAYELIRERGGLCVADEVQTGFGRLGSHYWGFESQGVVPDIVTLAKGIGNGFPLGAVVTTKEVAEVMGRSLHFNTYGGNPMACAVGSAVLDVIDEEGLQLRSGKVGEVFLRGMMQLRDEFEVVGDVRGKGLMLALEMVKSKSSKEPLPVAEVNEIWEYCKEDGVLLGKGGLYGSVFRIKPPMCVTEDDAQFAVDVLRKALLKYQK